MDLSNTHILSLLVFLPLAGGLFLCLVPGRELGVARVVALVWSLVVFVLSLLLLAGFGQDGGMQFVERAGWIPSLGIDYHVGIDGISLFLVLLTTFLTPIVILAAWSGIKQRVREYLIFLLTLETAMIGALVALDIFLFYVFWELMLIPMYFLIGVWGGERRLYATVKFFLFTMAGSVLMLVALIWLYLAHHAQFGLWSASLSDLTRVAVPLSAQTWLFAAFAIAFAIKVPMVPLHTWLPDAHTEAPTGGSVILAGVLLKMGTYGFLRFALPLFPVAAYRFAPWIAMLAVTGIVYGALVAMVQRDVKRLVAYSSVSHLGFVMLGIAAFTSQSLAGGIYQMLAHGISTGALFLLVGVIYERRHTRLIADFGGLARPMPFYAALFVITALASAGLPGLAGFVGEFLVLIGSFDSGMLNESAGAGWLPPGLTFSRLLVAAAATGVILSAVYLLWMLQRVLFGPVTRPENGSLRDLSLREACVLLPLVGLMFLMGVAPNFFLSRMEPSIDLLMNSFRARYEQSVAGTEADAEPSPLAGLPGPGDGR